MEAGYRLPLANPAAIQQYSGLKYSDAHSDARWLAHLLHLGVLPEGYIYPKAQRPVRDLLRKRQHLVKQQTANVLSLQNIILRNTGARLSGNRVKQLSQADIAILLPDEDQALAGSSGLAVVPCLAEQITVVEKRVHTQLRSTPLYKLLQTVPGIGPMLAQTILLETGDITRFPSVGDYASYCRCVDSTKVSNGKRKGQGNVKNGQPYLSWAYAEAATFAMRLHPRVQRYYPRKQAKTTVPVARKTVAHKLARACYHILRHQVSFDAATVFSEPLVVVGLRCEA
jgi:transposase